MDLAIVALAVAVQVSAAVFTWRTARIERHVVGWRVLALALTGGVLLRAMVFVDGFWVDPLTRAVSIGNSCLFLAATVDLSRHYSTQRSTEKKARKIMAEQLAAHGVDVPGAKG